MTHTSVVVGVARNMTRCVLVLTVRGCMFQLPPEAGLNPVKAVAYEVKLTYLLPWWNVYEWASTKDPRYFAERYRLLERVATDIVYHPQMTSRNVQLKSAGVQWVGAQGSEWTRRRLSGMGNDAK